MIPVKYCIAYEEQSMSDGIEVVVNRYSDFDFGQMHTHAFIEICFISSGSGWHLLNDQVCRCRPGDLFVIDTGDAHTWIADNDTQMTIYNLIFRPAFFDPALKGHTALSDAAGSFLIGGLHAGTHAKSVGVHFDENEFPSVLSLYDSMLAEYEERDAGFIEYIRACAVQLLVSIFRKQMSSASASDTVHCSAPSLAPVFDYINLHFTEDISLNQLSALVYLSPSYFSRVFRLYTGYTMTEYIQRVRIYNARTQLQHTQLSVSEIAAANGYSDPKHFTRIFRRILGMSPTQFRHISK